jgi:hypothetical protein
LLRDAAARSSAGIVGLRRCLQCWAMPRACSLRHGRAKGANGSAQSTAGCIADLKKHDVAAAKSANLSLARTERQLPSVPAPAAVPSATEQQDDENNDEKRGGIHVRLLQRCARISALRVMHSSCNRMLWSAAPFHMRHRSITAISAGAKDERPLARHGAVRTFAGRLKARCGLRSRLSGLRALRQPDPCAVSAHG